VSGHGFLTTTSSDTDLFPLVNQTDRKLPDGTLRLVGIVYRGGRVAGETAVFIPGMVVSAGVGRR
jgi:hypothetical protein